jgi:hypothetical protein
MNIKLLRLKIAIKYFVCVLCALATYSFQIKNSHAQTNSLSTTQNYLLGKWITDDKDVIEFYQNKNNYEGKIILLGDASIAKKHPEIIGAIIFKKLELVNGEFINGTYFEIESKNSYKVSIKIISPKLIKLKFGSGLFSQTSEFKKVN